MADRKLFARNERIQNLETLLQDANEKLNSQNVKFEAKLQIVRERLDQAQGELPSRLSCTPVTLLKRASFSAAQGAGRPGQSQALNFGRIAKPLRGGGGDVEPA